MTARDWKAWHEDYRDPTSRLSQRLAVVQSELRAVLDSAAPGPIRLLSACAGEGHDVVGALAGHPRRHDVEGLLIEWDPELSRRSADLLAEAGLPAIAAVQGDAGIALTYAAGVPADVLLLCGVFGNVPVADVQSTVRGAASLCAPGATVLWTRHRREPDLTPAVRAWWAEAGYEETSFVSPGPGEFAVGTCRLVGEPLPYDADRRLFAFS